MKKSFFKVLVVLVFIIGIVFIVKNNKYKKSLKYSIEKIENEKYFLMMDNSKYGVIDKNGQVIIQPKYDIIEIPNPEKAVFICKDNYDDKTKEYNVEVYDDSQNRILYQYYIVEAIGLNVVAENGTYEKSVLKYKSNNKYGLIDFSGNKITDAVYDEIEGFECKEGMLLTKKNGKYGIININGAQILKEKYDEILCDSYYDENDKYDKAGYIVGIKTKDGMRYGYVDSNRKEILKCKYTEIYRINEKKENIYLIVFENGRAGLYENKKKIIENLYEDLSYNSRMDLLILQRGAKLGVSKFDGTEVLPIEYDNVYFIGNNINAQKGEDIYIFDTNGKLDQSGYIEYHKVADGKYSIAVTSSEEYIIMSGDEIIKDNYSYIQYLFKDYFYVNQNNKSGIIDSNGRILIDIKYNVVQRLSNSNIIRLIDSEGTTILLDDSLNEIMKLKNAEVIFYNDYFKIESKDGIYYIDKEGKLLEGKDLFANNKLFMFCENSKCGFKDKSGKIVIPNIYDKATEFNKYGYAGINLGGKWGVIDENGKVIIEPKYKINQIREPIFIGEYYKVDNGYGNSYYTKE